MFEYSLAIHLADLTSFEHKSLKKQLDQIVVDSC